MLSAHGSQEALALNGRAHVRCLQVSLTESTSKCLPFENLTQVRALGAPGGTRGGGGLTRWVRREDCTLRARPMYASSSLRLHAS